MSSYDFYQNHMITNISELQWDNKQPEQLNYLRPTAFRFLIQGLPKVAYFCQSANIPSVSLGVAKQPTPFVDIPRPGEKLEFGELTIKFLIQEDMANYVELYNWLISLGFPDDYSEFRQRFQSQAYRNAQINNGDAGVGGIQTVARKTDMTEFSDATLLILNSDNNSTAAINFKNCFPINLTSAEFDISSGQTQYLTAMATFKYQVFSIETMSK